MRTTFPIVADYLKLRARCKAALAKGKIPQVFRLREQMERQYAVMTAAAQQQLAIHDRNEKQGA